SHDSGHQLLRRHHSTIGVVAPDAEHRLEREYDKFARCVIVIELNDFVARRPLGFCLRFGTGRNDGFGHCRTLEHIAQKPTALNHCSRSEKFSRDFASDWIVRACATWARQSPTP